MALLTVLSGCDNFLSEKPRGIISPKSYFKNDAQITSAINGLYSVLYRGNMYGIVAGIYQFYESGADTEGPSRPYGAARALMTYTMNPGNIGGEGAGAKGTWKDLYYLIRNANFDISKIKANKTVSQDSKDKALGQALFLRAFAYYNLTNLWGDVPYYREPIPVSKMETLSRTSKKKIRQDMVKDLQKAMSLLPSTWPQDQLGRANKWAAEFLLAKFNLWLKDWKGARDAVADLINNSPYHLLKDYANIFKPGNDYNGEIIWQLVWAKDTKQQRFTDFFVPRIRDEPLKSSAKQALIDSLHVHNQGFTGYGLAVPLPDLVKNWPDKKQDTRYQATIATEMYGYKLKFPYFRKMWDLSQISSPRGNHGDNYIFFRLGEAYLIAAEAENKLNGPSNAYQYINNIRERAGVSDLSGLTQAQFRKAVHKEYKWELAGEGRRRMELIRWGTLVKTVKHTEYWASEPAKNIQSYMTLLPIPAQALQRNPNLTQNSGYK